MGNFQEMLIVFGAKYLIFLLLFVFASYFLKSSKDVQKRMIIFSVMALPLSYVIAKLSSYFYYDARPFVVGNFTPLISHAADNGFPSDHTLLAGAVALVALYFNRKIGAALFVLAILVGASRVLAGVHHTTDIIGSFVIVSLVSFLTYKYILPIAMKFVK